jgi:hypothetical protein
MIHRDAVFSQEPFGPPKIEPEHLTHLALEKAARAIAFDGRILENSASHGLDVIAERMGNRAQGSLFAVLSCWDSTEL